MNFFCKGNTAVCMAGRVTLSVTWNFGESPVQALFSLSPITQGELVKDLLCQAAFRGPRVAQVADLILQLLDELDLLVQVAGPQEVESVGVAWPAGAGRAGSG